MEISISQIKRWFMNYNEKLQKEKMHLTELDQAIGDGDHGFNMARGWQVVSETITLKEYEHIGAMFKETGMILLSKVGGASGPLYGTAFLKAASTLDGEKAITIQQLADSLDAALLGIKARGKANRQEKTMIDVWEPAIAFLKEKGDQVNWNDFIIAVQNSMEATKDIEAKKGRASYLGKRSIGHTDPGAASSSYFFQELALLLKGDQIA